MNVTCRGIAVVVVASIAVVGCNVDTALERLSEARRLSADILVQFTKAADTANLAVMADTDETSTAFAREAARAKEAIEKDTAALKPILQGLGYTEETRLLEEFGSHFARYQALDETILELAVQNTNLKAQRLAFGPAREAADRFRDALGSVHPTDAADEWRVRALAQTAVIGVREIQAMQAPHIAEADDARMTVMEGQMATAEAAARRALAGLQPFLDAPSSPRFAASGTALDGFMAINAQIITLSRRNTDVRSLALSLNEKGKLAAACEGSLHTLTEDLAKRGFTGTR